MICGEVDEVTGASCTTDHTEKTPTAFLSRSVRHADRSDWATIVCWWGPRNKAAK